MESLLSVAFDNISSKSPKKISKGLRQIEGLLAQICLSSSLSDNAPASKSSRATKARLLDELVEDLAFREFFRLQESFEWNVASTLIECLERLLGMGNNAQTDKLITASLDLLQGILLLHPPSRTLFGRERNMNLLLDLLTPPSPTITLTSTLHVLVCALLSSPLNTRVFERCSGIATLTSLFKAKESTEDLRLKVVEFFYFYLMPEIPESASESNQAGNTTVSANEQQLQGNSFASSTRSVATTSSIQTSATATTSITLTTSSSSSTSATSSQNLQQQGSPPQQSRTTRTTTEKQALLGKYFAGVEDLVQDLKDSGALFAAPSASSGVPVMTGQAVGVGLAG